MFHVPHFAFQSRFTFTERRNVNFASLPHVPTDCFIQIPTSFKYFLYLHIAIIDSAYLNPFNLNENL